MKLIKLTTPDLLKIDESKSNQIRKVFEPMANMLAEFETDFNAISEESSVEITKKTTVNARALRLQIAKVRIQTEKARKQQKQQYLLGGRAIDGISNILKDALGDKESKLKNIEEHFITLEKEALKLLQDERAKLLSSFVDDASDRLLSDMAEDVWLAYLSTKQTEFNDKQAAIALAEKRAKELLEAQKAKRLKQLEDDKLAREQLIKEKEAAEAKALAIALKAEAEREIAQKKADAEKEEMLAEQRKIALKAEAEREIAHKKELELSKRQAVDDELIPFLEYLKSSCATINESNIVSAFLNSIDNESNIISAFLNSIDLDVYHTFRNKKTG